MKYMANSNTIRNYVLEKTPKGGKIIVNFKDRKEVHEFTSETELHEMELQLLKTMKKQMEQILKDGNLEKFDEYYGVVYKKNKIFINVLSAILPIGLSITTNDIKWLFSTLPILACNYLNAGLTEIQATKEIVGDFKKYRMYLDNCHLLSQYDCENQNNITCNNIDKISLRHLQRTIESLNNTANLKKA